LNQIPESKIAELQDQPGSLLGVAVPCSKHSPALVDAGCQIGAPEDDDDEEGLARLWVRLTMSM